MTHSAMTKYQRQPNNKVALKTVPKVRLYVDRPEEEEKWFVNIGHVTERGRWRTEPHAHPEYGQVIFVRSGRGVMNLEGSSVPFEGPCVLLLPTECVHGLDYEIDVDRWVVTIEVSYLTQVNARLHEFIQLWSLPRMIALSSAAGSAAEFFGLVTRLAQELESKTFGHVVGTEALLTQIFLMLVRGTQLDQPDNGGASRNEIRLADRFRELIDQHYRQNLPLQAYASKMAVSLVQLRAACAAATGQSPTKMIHARIITEAKRNLIFGEMSVEQIAFGLGFSDAAYFTRFFRREVGEAPSQFRVTAREQSQRTK
ncbi:transcriptional regulator, AraC family [Paraburkholderia fungorum]|uniref:Transcriptional regulator, AraC family n=1 Tax=Paraburkholderia fungorum TaxID=134537 RepID=A0A1H1IU11_9BURK|nr:helix-turn-helix domain-containing protein [Paraburkholderia fungorum]SDR41090.1 transcriptional regulator, AraC family [Paraburkholderia fungorum]